MKFLAFAASHRKDSLNRQLIGLAAQILKESGSDVEIVEYDSLDMPLYNDETFQAAKLPAALAAFVGKMSQTHGLLIASPEYNWSYPGSVKNIIDWVSRVNPNPMQHKTAFLLSASRSLKGGVLGLTHLRLPLEALGMHLNPSMYTLSKAADAFDEKGQMRDPKQLALLKEMLSSYSKVTHALKEIV